MPESTGKNTRDIVHFIPITQIAHGVIRDAIPLVDLYHFHTGAWRRFSIPLWGNWTLWGLFCNNQFFNLRFRWWSWSSAALPQDEADNFISDCQASFCFI